MEQIELNATRELIHITVLYIDVKKCIQNVHTLFDYNFCNTKVKSPLILSAIHIKYIIS